MRTCVICIVHPPLLLTSHTRRGAKALSRLANYYPERFTAYAWLAVPFVTPSPLVDFSVVQQIVKQRVGYDMYGYWQFFSEDDADKVIQEHVSLAIHPD